jgi:hypothetical protein
MQTGAQVASGAVQDILSRIDQLDQLAAKLGTTAAHVWDIYVAQAKIEAIRDTGSGVVLLAISLFLGTYVRGILWKQYQTSEDEGYDGDGWLSGCVFTLSIAGFLIIPAICNFYDAIPEWLNPQYWAFQHITQNLKNLF